MLYNEALRLDPIRTPLLSNLGPLLTNTSLSSAIVSMTRDSTRSGGAFGRLVIGSQVQLYWGGTLVVEYDGAAPLSGRGPGRLLLASPRPEFIAPTPDEGQLLYTAPFCDFEILVSFNTSSPGHYRVFSRPSM